MKLIKKFQSFKVLKVQSENSEPFFIGINVSKISVNTDGEQDQ